MSKVNVLSKKRKVLVIDDNEQNLELTSEILSNAGYETLSASSGIEGFNVLQKYRPDAILLDIMMPGMDGYEFCEELGNRNIYNIKIIFLSAKAGLDDKVKGLNKLGVHDYITKPFNASELVARMDILFRSKGIRRERESIMHIINDDLKYGASIQKRILVREPEMQSAFMKSGYNLETYTRNTDNLQSVYYCHKEINQQSNGVMLASVLGNGIPAALLTMRISSIIDYVDSPKHHPSEFMDTLNEHILGIFSGETPVAAIYIIFSKGRMIISNAGQPKPILIQGAKTGFVDICDPCIEVAQTREFNEKEIRLEVGDKVIVYSKGLINSTNSDDDEDNQIKLINTVKRNSYKPSNGIKNAIIEEYISKEGQNKLQDNIVLLIIECHNV